MHTRPITIHLMQAYEFSHQVLEWFDHHGRKDLPWQVKRNPYRVWVSEIMLQQTQVTTVIPYFNRFMARFPDVSSLAGAELVDVTDHWAGLGYYARARHLHLAAKALNHQHAGEFPSSLDALQSLPGIGRSTAGAILSLGMNQRAAILDGNVKRVLCRFAGIEGWPGETGITRQLWELSENLTPILRVADYNQAMMDLGATVCTRNKPTCENCPLKADCEARATRRTHMIPTPRPKRDIPSRQRFLLVMRNPNDEIFLENRPPTGIWANLKSFPEFDSLDDLEAWCTQKGHQTQRMTVLPQRRHTFSHYHLDFTAVICPVNTSNTVSENLQSGWFAPRDVRSLPAPIRTLLAELDPQIADSP
jgi:A/G-specific adenine glycosylase